MYHVCDRGKISESIGQKLREVGYTKRRRHRSYRQEANYIHRESLRNLSASACPATDRRFNVCLIGLNMHFGFENNSKRINCLFYSAMRSLIQYDTVE